MMRSMSARFWVLAKVYHKRDQPLAEPSIDLRTAIPGPTMMPQQTVPPIPRRTPSRVPGPLSAHTLPAALSLMIAGLLLGCDSTPPPGDATVATKAAPSDGHVSRAPAVAGETGATAGSSLPAAPAAELRLRVAAWDEIENEIAAATGNIVVVDLWSHGCPPCLREFPELVALARRYPQGLVCIGVNLDYIGVASRPPESYLPRVEQFLTKQQATFLNFLCSTPDAEVYEQLGISSLPAILIFDAQGGQVAVLTESMLEPGQELTYADRVEPLVRPLVARLLENGP
jgi:thiol-disulfide isomerase/thioredoxin